MAIAGALIGDKLLNAFGEKPDIPELPRIRPGEVQRRTIQEQQEALPGARELATAVNRFRRQEGARALQSIGGEDVVRTGTQQLASMLRGEIPEDVGRQVEQRSAQRAAAGGFGGSGMQRALTARDLGLTSLNLIQQGINSAGQWLNQALQVSQPGGFFDVSSMFFTPQERLAFEERDRAQRFQRDLLAEQVRAAPDPGDVALAREIDRFFNTAAQVGMMSAGGGFGGGGGVAGMAGAAGGGGAGVSIGGSQTAQPFGSGGFQSSITG